MHRNVLHNGRSMKMVFKWPLTEKSINRVNWLHAKLQLEVPRPMRRLCRMLVRAQVPHKSCLEALTCESDADFFFFHWGYFCPVFTEDLWILKLQEMHWNMSSVFSEMLSVNVARVLVSNYCCVIGMLLKWMEVLSCSHWPENRNTL